MKLLISFLNDQINPIDWGNAIGVYDTEKDTMKFIPLPLLGGTKGFNPTGMCYVNNHLYIAVTPYNSVRLTGKIYIINIENGIHGISNITFAKGLHDIQHLEHNKIIACSTQTDLLVEMWLDDDGNVISEDLIVQLNNRFEKREIYTFGEKSYNWRGELEYDDNFHLNGVCVHNGEIIISLFHDYKKKKKGTKYDFTGTLYNLTKDNIIMGGLLSPHSPMIDSDGTLCVCNSGHFEFIKKHTSILSSETDTTICRGYCRGICEDVDNKGHWVGLSLYRKFSKTDNKWVERRTIDDPIEGASLQFIRKEPHINNQEVINLSRFTENPLREIFTIIPYKEGIYGS